MSLNFKVHMETFSWFSDGFTSIINSLISKQNKTPKTDPKMLKR